MQARGPPLFFLLVADIAAVIHSASTARAGFSTNFRPRFPLAIHRLAGVGLQGRARPKSDDAHLDQERRYADVTSIAATSAPSTDSTSVPQIVALSAVAQAPGATVQDEVAYTSAALAAMPGLLEVVRATGLLYFRDDVVGCVALGRHALREVGINTLADYERAFGA